DAESGIRYAITQWEGQQDEILNEFKRMCLSDHLGNDERLLEIHLIARDIVNQVCAEESSYELDDHELAALSAIFEKEYYGYIADAELVLAMDRLFSNVTDTNQHEQHLDKELVDTTSTFSILQSDQPSYPDDDMEDYC
ncbi:unnamed protein product, partial [Rotaria magnacalcarata]